MVSIKSLHTFGCAVSARDILEISQKSELVELYDNGFFSNNKWLFIGGGSNVLFTKDFEGTILVNKIHGKEILDITDDGVRVRFGSGENWHSVVLWALDKGYNGIENMSLIPGTVGAAPMQNIGAYGVEIKDVFQSLIALDIETGKELTFDGEACRFGYRDSVFKQAYKGRAIILSVDLCLKRDGKVNVSYGDILKTLENKGAQHPYTPKDVSEAVIHIRKNKLPNPAEIGNAGSFFKNPIIEKSLYDELRAKHPNIPGFVVDDNHVKVPAGWLIEHSGYKGKRRGQVGSYVTQALVLVNYGEGTGSEILDFAHEIQDAVFRNYHIEVHPEVNIY
ncbi:MAG: UDP-N-acetylmuramate dehydrogenase [Saprospiraceae bacterium]|jgi:UDP-N-acetylmuramate dehydrogenase|nr:UDP-N-acetylmuramate dehydrogenase [Saprospiraceae bacterium]